MPASMPVRTAHQYGVVRRRDTSPTRGGDARPPGCTLWGKPVGFGFPCPRPALAPKSFHASGDGGNRPVRGADISRAVRDAPRGGGAGDVADPCRAIASTRSPVSPMRDVAHEFGVPIVEPEDVNSEASIARLAGYGADLMVVCDYGQILTSETLATARLGGINLHASLLPKYRGAAPINWAIYHGETETGVTVIHMTPRVDAGPCIAQASTPIDPDETAVELEARLRGNRRLAGPPDDRLARGGAPRGLAAGPRAGLEGPAAEEDRRPDRLEPAGPGDQEPRPGDGAVAEDVHVLAPARRPARPAHPRHPIDRRAHPSRGQPGHGRRGRRRIAWSWRPAEGARRRRECPARRASGCFRSPNSFAATTSGRGERFGEGGT